MFQTLVNTALSRLRYFVYEKKQLTLELSQTHLNQKTNSSSTGGRGVGVKTRPGTFFFRERKTTENLTQEINYPILVRL